MKLFSWMQSKLQGKVKFHNKESHYSSFPSIQSDDFVDEEEGESIPSLPIGLLAIGTFGNDNGKSNSNNEDPIDDETVLEFEAENGEGDNKSHRNSIVKKSIPFLVKKLFVCGSGSSGFAVTLPLPRLLPTPQDARMNKILKMMLHKKIYPKNSSNTAPLKRFIKEKEMSDKRNEDNKEYNN